MHSSVLAQDVPNWYQKVLQRYAIQKLQNTPEVTTNLKTHSWFTSQNINSLKPKIYLGKKKKDRKHQFLHSSEQKKSKLLSWLHFLRVWVCIVPICTDPLFWVYSFIFQKIPLVDCIWQKKMDYISIDKRKISFLTSNSMLIIIDHIYW